MSPHSRKRPEREQKITPPPPAPSVLAKAGQILKIDNMESGIAFEVKVVPRSARNHVAGTHGDRLHVKVNAPPIEGAANHAVCSTIAKALGVPLRQVSIIRGLASRMKRIYVEGLKEADARKAFAL